MTIDPALRVHRTRCHAAPSRRGTALVLSLVTVMIIASLGAGLVQLHTAIDRRHEFAIDRKRALYLAEAGLGEAALAVSQGRSGAIASEAVPAAYGGGVYWVESDDLPDDRVVLRCTARISTAEFVVRTMIVPNVNPVTRLGIFGTDGVNIGWGSTVDGYHSGRGDFASQVDPALPVTSTGSLGLVGSDADIVLSEVRPLAGADAVSAGAVTGFGFGGGGSWGSTVSGDDGSGGSTGGGTGTSGGTGSGSTGVTDGTTPTHIYGQLRPGATSAVRSDGNSVIVGTVDPYDAPPVLPEITVPTPNEVLNVDLTISSDQTNIGANVQTWVQGDITVTTGATLTLTGPAVIRCGALIVQSRARLVLDDSSGPIHVYATEGFNLVRDSELLTPADEELARGTYLFVPGSAGERDRVNLRCSGTFHGAIYAPDDVIRIPETLRWLGSAVGRVVATAPGAHVTVDRRLVIGGDGLPAVPRQLTWQVVPMGKEVARQLPIDPILQLALNGVTPTPSAVAAIETNVTLHYIDLSGQEATYTGPLTGFNRANATRILGARWTDPRDGSQRGWATPSGSESTGAIADVRTSLQSVRATILGVTPTMDVATLSDEEVTNEVATATTGVDIALVPLPVKRAKQRTDTTDADLTPEPDVAATNSANDADSLATKSEVALADAQALAGASVDPTVLDLVNQITAASQDARAASDAAATAAATAATATGAALDAAVTEAANYRDRAELSCNTALALYVELDALI